MTDIIAHLRAATNADPHKYEVSISIREAKQILAKLEDQQAEIDRLRQQMKVDEFCGKLRDLPAPPDVPVAGDIASTA
jgi:hypothetical protein